MKLQFKRNMGTADRILRFTVGSILLLFGPLTGVFTSDLLSNVILGTVGIFAAASAAFAYCLLYEMSGFCTMGKQKNIQT